MSATSEYYRDRAAECARDAQNTTLENVRDRCLRSEAAWLAMAARISRNEAMRANAEAAKVAAGG